MNLKEIKDTAVCAACLTRKVCVTTRWIEGSEQVYQNFKYLKELCGWICRRCERKLEKTGQYRGDPEILKHG